MHCAHIQIDVMGLVKGTSTSRRVQHQPSQPAQQQEEEAGGGEEEHHF